MEGYKLRETGLVAMRQITALVPAAKTLPGILGFQGRKPASPALDQITDAGIVRWPGTAGFGSLTHDEY